MERVRAPKGSPPPLQLVAHKTPTNIEIPIPSYPGGRIPTYGRILSVPSRVPRIAHPRSRPETRIEGTVVLPLHIPAHVDLKQVKRRFAYIVSWVDDPAVKIAVPGTEILDYVTPRTLEDFEYGEWIKREQQAAAGPDAQPAEANKKRGRPRKKDAIAMLNPSPSPPRSGMAAKGPSLSTPQKAMASAPEPYETDGPGDAVGFEAVGGLMNIKSPYDNYREPPSRRRSRAPDSDSSSRNIAFSPESASPEPHRSAARGQGTRIPTMGHLSRAETHTSRPSSASRSSSRVATPFLLSKHKTSATGTVDAAGLGTLRVLETDDDSLDDGEQRVDMSGGDQYSPRAGRSSTTRGTPHIVAGPLSDYVPPSTAAMEARPPIMRQSPANKRQRVSRRGRGIPVSLVGSDAETKAEMGEDKGEDQARFTGDWEVQTLEDEEIDDYGNRYYLVRWKGDWPEDENPTWEPEENVSESLVRDYERRKAREKRDRRRRQYQQRVGERERERHRPREQDAAFEKVGDDSKTLPSPMKAETDRSMADMARNAPAKAGDREGQSRHGDRRGKGIELKQTTLSWNLHSGFSHTK